MLTDHSVEILMRDGGGEAPGRRAWPAVPISFKGKGHEALRRDDVTFAGDPTVTAASAGRRTAALQLGCGG